MEADPVRWYDRVAPIYDLAIFGVYGRARRVTADQLRLEPGHSVLDVACGTGENIKYIEPAITPSGVLVCTDYSEGMLAQAKRKIERQKWDNVHLLHADARTLTIEGIRDELSLPDLKFDRVVSTLGYSVVPDWQVVFERTWALLEPGGRYVIMDWYVPRETRFTGILRRISAGELNRRWWGPLQERSESLEREHLFRGMIQVVSGSKPADDQGSQGN